MAEYKIGADDRFKLVGKDYTTPDMIAKVTGRSK